jgi:membrane associated rhomboid family serine protease
MKHARGRVVLVVAFLIGFGIELLTGSIGNDAALLKLGALPDDGQLHGQYWRIATYSFLHFNWVHLLVNALLPLWIGRIVEMQLGTPRAALVYFTSVLCSAALILFVHNWHPKTGATVGASGGAFGLLAAAVIISYRQDVPPQLRVWLWIALLVGLGVSLLPKISMAGHIGGMFGGALVAVLTKPHRNETGRL